MTVSVEGYLAVVTETTGRVAAGQREAVGRAVDLLAEALRADGVIHAFGTGHSEALAMEIAGAGCAPVVAVWRGRRR
ncbi:SIS domain-containing protein [Micromonospora sp. KC606]|uniref:SIS domain-containing protein n=1 Tax=Micromonospora sp. KC606 TaxID=2530379 RepID=UPI001FB6BCE0|nr:SIS domain-containing protein [Micromonospora sp. KC606]